MILESRLFCTYNQKHMNTSNDHPIFQKMFNDIYPCYVAKAEKKGRTGEEVDKIILWLTGYSQGALTKSLKGEISLGDFIDHAPQLHPAREKITGSICGIRVQDLEVGRMQELRYLDKLIDELAQGKDMQKILRIDSEGM